MSQGYPLNFCVYKGKSALRLNLTKSKEVNNETVMGYLYAEVANAKNTEPRSYDWANGKIGAKLGVADISKMIYAIDSYEDCTMYHEYNGGSTTITLTKNTGNNPYFFKVSSKRSESSNTVSVPLSKEETYALSLMLKHALIKIHNW